jgi:hypothetical protein
LNNPVTPPPPHKKTRSSHGKLTRRSIPEQMAALVSSSSSLQQYDLVQMDLNVILQQGDQIVFEEKPKKWPNMFYSSKQINIFFKH